jgi:hypothetical protein
VRDGFSLPVSCSGSGQWEIREKSRIRPSAADAAGSEPVDCGALFAILLSNKAGSH